MKKIKIAGIILAGLIILIAALITVSGISKKSYLETAIPEEGGYEASLNALPQSSKSGRPVSNSSLGSESVGSAMKSAPEDSTSITDKKVIKTGDLTLKVDSIDKAAEKISQTAKDNGGEIFSSNIYQAGNNIKRGVITVKVPFANFEKTIGEFKEIAALVVSESTAGQDVTEEYADLQARIKNKQAEEQSYIKILNQAQKIQDILDITQSLSNVRGEIERIQGRIKFMENQTSMSTISISLSEDQDVTIVDSWRPLQIAKNAINSLIKSSQGFLSFLIVLVITVIPVIILYALLAFIIYLIGRKIYRKIKSRKENNSIAQN